MQAARRIAASAGCVCVLLAVSVRGFDEARAEGRSSELPVDQRVETSDGAATPPHHLYLTSPLDGSVYAFRLSAGVPAAHPEWVITGLSYPVGVAVDEDGYIYVSDIGTSMVDVFSPGSNGPAQPIRQLPVYLRYLLAWRTNLVAQDAHDGVNVYFNQGDGVPIEKIYSAHSSQGMAAEPDGTLFLSWDSVSRLTVYHSALPPGRSIASPQITQVISLTNHAGFIPGLAVDERSIFAGLFTASSVQIAVLPVTANGPTTPQRVMITPSCNEGSGEGSYSFAVYSRYLYEACAVNDSVFLYDKRGSGTVQPLHTLHGSFPSLLQITLGP
jgi:hypothetical protein